MGWVPGRIVLQLDDQLLAAVDKGSVRAAGLTGIEGLDQLGRQLSVISLIPQFPGAKKTARQNQTVDLSGWFKVKFSDSINVENACKLYNRLPGVLAAQPIGIHSVDIIPNDYSFSLQWHLNQAGGHDVDGPEAWDLYTGQPGIIVGVLDTGRRYRYIDHDLAAGLKYRYLLVDVDYSGRQTAHGPVSATLQEQDDETA